MYLFEVLAQTRKLQLQLKWRSKVQRHIDATTLYVTLATCQHPKPAGKVRSDDRHQWQYPAKNIINVQETRHAMPYMPLVELNRLENRRTEDARCSLPERTPHYLVPLSHARPFLNVNAGSTCDICHRHLPLQICFPSQRSRSLAKFYSSDENDKNEPWVKHYVVANCSVDSLTRHWHSISCRMSPRRQYHRPRR